MNIILTDRRVLLISFAVTCAVHAYYLAMGQLYRGDSLQYYFFFKFAYENFFFYGELPQWMALAAYGVPADSYMGTFSGPAQLLTIFVGRMAGLENVDLAFRISLLADSTVLLLGLHLLSRRLFSNRLVMIAVTVSAIMFSMETVQIFWSFKILLFIPLMFWAVIRHFETGEWHYIWQGVAFFVFSLIGNLGYMAPIYALLVIVFSISLYISEKKLPPVSLRGIVAPASLLWLAIATITACLFAFLFSSAMGDSDIVFFSPGRDPTTFTVSLETFLTYGGRAWDKIPELLLGMPIGGKIEYFFYVGFTMFSLAAYAFLRAWRVRYFAPMAITTIFLFLLALGPDGPIAGILYNFPFMDRFRHLYLLLTTDRFLLIIVAGFGLDAILNNRHRFRELAIIIAVTSALFVGVKFLWFPENWTYGPLGWMPEPFCGAALILAVAAKTRIGTFLAGLVIVEATVVFLTFSHFLFPLEQAEKSMAEFSRERTIVRRPVFQASRTHQLGSHSQAPFFKALLPFQVVRNSTLFLMTGIDPCLPIFRVDYTTRLVNELLHREFGEFRWDWRGAPKISRNASANFFADVSCSNTKLQLIPNKSFQRLAPPATTKVTHFSANRLRIELTGVAREGGSKLYYADAFHSGWNATIDGKPTTVQIARSAFKSIDIPPGDHVAEFQFFDWRKEWARRIVAFLWLVSLAYLIAKAVRNNSPEPNQSSLHF